MISTWLYFGTLITLPLVLLVAGQVGVARFNARGVNGYISFTVQSDGVQIQANLQGLVGEYYNKIHAAVCCWCLAYSPGVTVQP